MARALADLERDIRTLSKADRDRLLDFLMLDADVPPEEARVLVRNLKETVQGINESLDETIAYLEGLDDRLDKARTKAREEVLQSGERWPFAAPPGAEPTAT